MATILIVDDHPHNREFLVALLGYVGHTLLEASDGAEALEIVRAARPDLVIADLLMQTVDGYEFVRQLRADPAIAQTEVIYFTATHLEGAAQALAQSAGVAHILVTPAAPEVILDTVAEALAHPATVRASGTSMPPAEGFDREHFRLLTDQQAYKVEELTLVNARLAALLDLSQRMATQHDPIELLQSCCDAGRRIIGALYAAIHIFDDDGQSTRHFRDSRLSAGAAVQLSIPPLAPALLARLRAASHPLRVRDIGADEPQSGLPGQHQPIHSLLGVPIKTATQRYGILYLIDKLGGEEFGVEDEQIVITLAAQLAVAIQNLRLFEQVRVGRERLQRLSQQLVRTQESERRHIARELHDEIGQSLTAAQLNLQVLVGITDLTELPSRLEDSLALIDRVLQQVRALSLDLRPSMLDDLGLVPALRWYLNRQAERAGFSVELHSDQTPERFPPDLETTCFRIAQEALNNIVRYAHAKYVVVELRQRDNVLHLTISDDGVGFDVAAALRRAAIGRSLGLVSMQERAVLLGGMIQFESAPDRGTSIYVQLPLATSREAARQIERRHSSR